MYICFFQGSSGQSSNNNVSSLLSNRSKIRLPNAVERLKRSGGRTQDARHQQAREGDQVASCSSKLLHVLSLISNAGLNIYLWLF